MIGQTCLLPRHLATNLESTLAETAHSYGFSFCLNVNLDLIQISLQLNAENSRGISTNIQRCLVIFKKIYIYILGLDLHQKMIL